MLTNVYKQLTSFQNVELGYLAVIGSLENLDQNDQSSPLGHVGLSSMSLLLPPVDDEHGILQSPVSESIPALVAQNNQFPSSKRRNSTVNGGAQDSMTHEWVVSHVCPSNDGNDGVSTSHVLEKSTSIHQPPGSSFKQQIFTLSPTRCNNTDDVTLEDVSPGVQCFDPTGHVSHSIMTHSLLQEHHLKSIPLAEATSPSILPQETIRSSLDPSNQVVAVDDITYSGSFPNENESNEKLLSGKRSLVIPENHDTSKSVSISLTYMNDVPPTRSHNIIEQNKENTRDLMPDSNFTDHMDSETSSTHFRAPTTEVNLSTSYKSNDISESVNADLAASPSGTNQATPNFQDPHSSSLPFMSAEQSRQMTPYMTSDFRTFWESNRSTGSNQALLSEWDPHLFRSQNFEALISHSFSTRNKQLYRQYDYNPDE